MCMGFRLLVDDLIRILFCVFRFNDVVWNNFLVVVWFKEIFMVM